MPTNDSAKPTVNLAKLTYLAQFSLSAAEQAAATTALEAIIGMIDEMRAADIEQVAAMSHPLDLTTRLRADEVTQVVERERYQAQAPEAENGLYLVPPVIE